VSSPPAYLMKVSPQTVVEGIYEPSAEAIVQDGKRPFIERRLFDLMRKPIINITW